MWEKVRKLLITFLHSKLILLAMGPTGVITPASFIITPFSWHMLKMITTRNLIFHILFSNTGKWHVKVYNTHCHYIFKKSFHPSTNSTPSLPPPFGISGSFPGLCEWFDPCILYEIQDLPLIFLSYPESKHDRLRQGKQQLKLHK